VRQPQKKNAIFDFCERDQNLKLVLLASLSKTWQKTYDEMS